MKLLFHKNFTKAYQKLGKNTRLHAQERFVIFAANPYDPTLNNHPLKGKYKGCYSINITGDIRAVYELVSDEAAYFIAIDSHSNLYH